MISIHLELTPDAAENIFLLSSIGGDEATTLAKSNDGLRTPPAPARVDPISCRTQWKAVLEVRAKFYAEPTCKQSNRPETNVAVVEEWPARIKDELTCQIRRFSEQ